MKRPIFILTVLFLVLAMPVVLFGLTPEETKAYSDYQKKMAPLVRKAPEGY